MGVGVSGWRLARAVSERGQLGVVSGTALALTLARRLQLGDPGGNLSRAMARFPFPAMAQRARARYFIEGGKADDAPFRSIAMPALDSSSELTEMQVLAGFVEVFLAKEGHSGVVGINLLEKIQIPTLPTLYGAMLAGVDYVLMGAGIPRSVPGMLDHFAAGEPAEHKIEVASALADEVHAVRFDPAAFCGGVPPRLKRPHFLGIVASSILAMTLAKKSNGKVDGFVVEAETAGGHNAPPRGPLKLSEKGEPVYGPRDVVDFEKIRELGLPFWLAGSRGRAGELAAALALGAAGIQVGTAFAFCEESGMDAGLKRRVLEQCAAGKAVVFTDPIASPTGFPFKVVDVTGTISSAQVYDARERVCDLGYLRTVYRREDGTTGYRCAAEPIDAFVRKGGEETGAEGRKCLCNGLMATVGLGQTRSDGLEEPPLVTAGDDLVTIGRFLKPGSLSYNVDDVLAQLLAPAT